MIESENKKDNKRESNPELIAFGNRLYNLRTAYNYSYYDLEKITKERFKHQIARASWFNYEHGISEPGLTNLRIMSNIFNVSVDYLIGLTDKPMEKNE